MVRCEGPGASAGQSRECLNKNKKQLEVNSAQGDLFLCSDCEVARFGLGEPRKNTKPTRNKVTSSKTSPETYGAASSVAENSKNELEVTNQQTNKVNKQISDLDNAEISKVLTALIEEVKA